MASSTVYSVELNVPAKAGEGKPRRNPDWLSDEPFKTETPDITNLYANFCRGVAISGSSMARQCAHVLAAPACLVR